MKKLSDIAENRLKDTLPVAEAPMYRFLEYELDLTRWQLRWQGEPLTIYRKSFDLLLCLVKAHPRVVSKDELLEAVWPGQFVEENNLSQQISLLRKVLARHADAAGLIETVPGRGYRWCVPVEIAAPPAPALFLSAEESITRITLEEQSDEEPAEENAPLSTLPPARSLGLSPFSALVWPPYKHLRWWFAGLASLATLAFAGYFGYQRWQNRSSGPPVQVVLIPLEGSTGDITLDSALNNALRFDLAESPFVSLVSQSQVASTLHQMRRPASETLSPTNAREVCERTSSQAVLHAVLAHNGQHFLLTGEAISCVDGAPVASTSQEAGRAEDLPLSLNRLTGRLRHQLGEARRSVARFSTPAFTFQSSSLEALKANYQAGAFQHAGKFSDALEAEKRAVALDPDFASAYYDLAIVQSSLNAKADAQASMQRAYDLRSTVDPQMQMVITGGYASFVTGDLYAARRNAEVWVEEYPRAPLAWNALASARLG
ncbi:MAG: winged helix-turn-helix domain-containing protein, partial [Rhodospirillales bacterium]|nr:winged helix-turn-helix domain-containing protein [Acetobacter sp.]